MILKRLLPYLNHKQPSIYTKKPEIEPCDPKKRVFGSFTFNKHRLTLLIMVRL